MTYCGECRRSVVREDRVTVNGEVYHRQCAPDDAVEHKRLDQLGESGREGDDA